MSSIDFPLREEEIESAIDFLKKTTIPVNLVFFPGSRVSEDSMKDILSVFKQSNSIISLICSDIMFEEDPDAFPLFVKLLKCPHNKINSFTWTENSLLPNQLILLVEALRLAKIDHLDFEDSEDISNQFGLLFSPGSYFSSLSLRDMSLDYESLLQLTNFMKDHQCHITKLDLSKNAIEYDGFNALADAMCFRIGMIDELNLSESNLDEEQCDNFFVRFMKLPGNVITKLNLSRVKLGNNNCLNLLKALAFQSCLVEELQLVNEIKTSEQFMFLLDAIGSNRRLRKIDVRVYCETRVIHTVEARKFVGLLMEEECKLTAFYCNGTFSFTKLGYWIQQFRAVFKYNISLCILEHQQLMTDHFIKEYLQRNQGDKIKDTEEEFGFKNTCDSVWDDEAATIRKRVRFVDDVEENE